MKLKFELKRGNIENLHKLLQLASQIWRNDDKIFFYFDTDQMIIYPENRSGFDKVFARIHIANSSPKGISDVSTFFIFYVCRAKISCHLTKLKVKRKNQPFWSHHTTCKDLSLIWKFWWNWATMPCSSWLSARQMTKSRNISRSPEAMVARERGRLWEVSSRSTLILTRHFSQKKLNRKRLNLA